MILLGKIHTIKILCAGIMREVPFVIPFRKENPKKQTNEGIRQEFKHY